MGMALLSIRAFLVVTMAVGAAVAAAQQPPLPIFRSRITLVPVDVRVVGRHGTPITDLTKEDFTLSEDGARQEIVQFAFQSLETAPPSDALSAHNRVFLIVLGSGRQVGPVRGVEAAMKFVRDRLLPRDEVALIAYNRVTSFTNDHRRVLRTIERYWKHHEDIEWELTKRTGHVGLPMGDGPTLGGKYGYHDLPEKIQKRMDEIFEGPDALPTRSVFSAGLSSESAIPGFYGSRADAPGLRQWSLDYFIDAHYGTHVDVANIFAGIRYLRELKGEKHLIFLTPEGFHLPALESNTSLAVMAADARISVHSSTPAVSAPRSRSARSGHCRQCRGSIVLRSRACATSRGSPAATSPRSSAATPRSSGSTKRRVPNTCSPTRQQSQSSTAASGRLPSR